MTHAYNELYLNNAKILLADAFDYAINDCNLSVAFFSKIFVNSKYCRLYETGNPGVISGMSGEELIQNILNDIYLEDSILKKNFSLDKSPEFWAGYYLAYYQWFSGRKFKDIFNVISLDSIINMYDVYHEMDVTHFVETIEKLFENNNFETKLKYIREMRGLSQSQLAKESNVSLRMIQLYEQKENDIDKAQARSLDKLSRTLGCRIEDLLESRSN